MDIITWASCIHTAATNQPFDASQSLEVVYRYFFFFYRFGIIMRIDVSQEHYPIDASNEWPNKDAQISIDSTFAFA